jgi:hypothetical protein
VGPCRATRFESELPGGIYWFWLGASSSTRIWPWEVAITLAAMDCPITAHVLQRRVIEYLKVTATYRVVRIMPQWEKLSS